MLQFYTRITERGIYAVIGFPSVYGGKVMKKVLVSLLIAALAVSSAFAAVNFTGSLKTGYVIQYANDAWTSHVFGEDNTDTNSTQLKLNIADDNGVWGIGIRGILVSNGSNPDGSIGSRVAGTINLDIAKMVAQDTDWSLKLGVLAHERITTLRAYSNKSGLNYDRVRSDEDGVRVNLVAGYGKLIQVQVGGNPALTGSGVAGMSNGARGEFIVSAMTEPLDGLKVSVDWALSGDKQAGLEKAGVFGAAADIDIAKLCGLDFALGVGVADKWYYGTQGGNLIAAQVYGGIDAVDAYVEYVYGGLEADKDAQYVGTSRSRLHVGVNVNAVENLLINVYGGVGDFDAAADEWFIGANAAYTVAGVTFGLNLQYAAGAYLNQVGGDVSNGAVKATGFSITPTIAVNF